MCIMRTNYTNYIVSSNSLKHNINLCFWKNKEVLKRTGLELRWDNVHTQVGWLVGWLVGWFVGWLVTSSRFWTGPHKIGGCLSPGTC